MVTIKQALSSATFFCTLTAASTFSPATLYIEQASHSQHLYAEVHTPQGRGFSSILAPTTQLGTVSTPWAANTAQPTSFQQKESLLVLLQQRYALSRQNALRLHSVVMHYALLRNLSPDIILGVIRVESEFKPHAISPDGAKGLMQVMPEVHALQIRKLGRTAEDLLEPEFNVAMGTSILADALRRSRGNLRLALARYNGSSNANSEYVTKVLTASQEFRPYTNAETWS